MRRTAFAALPALPHGALWPTVLADPDLMTRVAAARRLAHLAATLPPGHPLVQTLVLHPDGAVQETAVQTLRAAGVQHPVLRLLFGG